MLALALIGPAVLARPASAQERIGAATVIRNDVSRASGTRTSALATGDTVFRDEAVQTGADSLAKLVFLDDTNLSLGPSARVELDRFVYSGANGAGRVGVNMARGAFRFVTGNADKRAYEIRTPVATIGIRGTVFDVVAAGGRTTVTLLEGEVRVCTRGGNVRCEVANQPGQVIVVTAGGIGRGAPGRGQDFSALCAGASGLCSATRFADAQTFQTAQAGGGGASLCGR